MDHRARQHLLTRMERLDLELLELLQQRAELMTSLGGPLEGGYDAGASSRWLEELVERARGHLEEVQVRGLFEAVFRHTLPPAPAPVLKIARAPGQPTRVIQVGGVAVGGGAPVLIAGPCAVEDRDQLEQVAARLGALGGGLLRGGAFKPRTSPDTFQGMGLEGLRLLREVGDRYGLPVVTEVVDPRHLGALVELADVIQVGTRNMFNYELLKACGEQPRPVLLKRSFMATVEEFILAAEYVARGGNEDILLCERGIRTFERSTRNTLDIAAVPLLKARTHLPVVVDLSHATGRRDLCVPLGRAALAAGADVLMVEAHPTPARALSDQVQQMTLEELEHFVGEVFRRG